MAGEPSLLICPGPGGLDTGKVDALCTLIEGDGYLSQKKIAQILGVHLETIKRILRDGLNMRRVNFKWVPHALNSSQRAVRSKFRESYLISWKAIETEVC
jgi:transposase